MSKHTIQKTTTAGMLLPVCSSTKDSLCSLLGLGATKVRELIKDPTFPKPVRLGSNNPRYIREEVIDWVNLKRDSQTQEADTPEKQYA